jgi:hypothetical protein
MEWEEIPRTIIEIEAWQLRVPQSPQWKIQLIYQRKSIKKNKAEEIRNCEGKIWENERVDGHWKDLG